MEVINGSIMGGVMEGDGGGWRELEGGFRVKVEGTATATISRFVTLIREQGASYERQSKLSSV